MAKGETPPVKDRLEMPVATQKTDTGLTPGLLRVLNKQVGYIVTTFYLKYDLLHLAKSFCAGGVWFTFCQRLKFTKHNCSCIKRAFLDESLSAPMPLLPFFP